MDIMTAIFAANKAKADLQASGKIGYTDTSTVVVIPEGSYEVTDGLFGVETAQHPNKGDLITFILDGVDYSEAAKTVYVADPGIEVVYIGNAAEFGGTDTGENYVVGFVPAPGQAALMLLDGSSGTHTIELSFVTPITHTIDPKYIPTTIINMDDTIGASIREETPATSLDEARLGAFLKGVENHNLAFTYYSSVAKAFSHATDYLVGPHPDSLGTVYVAQFGYSTSSRVGVTVFPDGSNEVKVTGIY